MVEALFPRDLANIIHAYMWFHGEVIFTHAYGTTNLTLTYTDRFLINYEKGVDTFDNTGLHKVTSTPASHAYSINGCLILARANVIVCSRNGQSVFLPSTQSQVSAFGATSDHHLIITRDNGELEIWDLSYTGSHKEGDPLDGDRNRGDLLRQSKRLLQVNFSRPVKFACPVGDRIGLALGHILGLWDYRDAMSIVHNPLIIGDVIRIDMGCSITALTCIGDSAVVGLYSGLIHVVTDCVITATFSGHTNVITALCVLEDGQIVSGSFDHTVRIWNPDTTCHKVLPYHVRTLAPLSGNRLAIGTMDGTVHILV